MLTFKSCPLIYTHNSCLAMHIVRQNYINTSNGIQLKLHKYIIIIYNYHFHYVIETVIYTQAFKQLHSNNTINDLCRIYCSKYFLPINNYLNRNLFKITINNTHLHSTNVSIYIWYQCVSHLRFGLPGTTISWFMDVICV